MYIHNLCICVYTYVLCMYFFLNHLRVSCMYHTPSLCLVPLYFNSSMLFPKPCLRFLENYEAYSCLRAFALACNSVLL